jgi:hypothetical protein
MKNIFWMLLFIGRVQVKGDKATEPAVNET